MVRHTEYRKTDRGEERRKKKRVPSTWYSVSCVFFSEQYKLISESNAALRFA
jgi:hypothetical protein